MTLDVERRRPCGRAARPARARWCRSAPRRARGTLRWRRSGPASPSWLASSSRIASALPVANGLKVLLSLMPLATMKFSTRTSSSRPKRRASAEHLAEQSRGRPCRRPARSQSPGPARWSAGSRMAVVLPAPVVPGMVMCWRASSAVIHSSWPFDAPADEQAAGGRAWLCGSPGVGIAVVRQAGAARQPHRQCDAPGQHPDARRAAAGRNGDVDDRRLEERAGRQHTEHEAGGGAAQHLRQPRRERPDVAQALRAGALELFLRPDDLARDHDGHFVQAERVPSGCPAGRRLTGRQDDGGRLAAAARRTPPAPARPPAPWRHGGSGRSGKACWPLAAVGARPGQGERAVTRPTGARPVGNMASALEGAAQQCQRRDTLQQKVAGPGGCARCGGFVRQGEQRWLADDDMDLGPVGNVELHPIDLPLHIRQSGDCARALRMAAAS